MRRYVRIGVSVLGVVVCCLLIAFWVRSYYYSSQVAGIPSFKGELIVRIFSRPASGIRQLEEVKIPYLLLVLLAATLAALPWVEWSRRYSLRALVVVSTLIAVVLGVTISN